MSTDLTFFTNEPDQTLLDRFSVTIEHNTRFFDVLSGFFRTSGFYHLYKSLDKTEKIRILVGISMDRHTYDLLQKAKHGQQLSLTLSHSEAKEDFRERIVSEMEGSPDKPDVEERVSKFIKWIKSGKLYATKSFWNGARTTSGESFTSRQQRSSAGQKMS